MTLLASKQFIVVDTENGPPLVVSLPTTCTFGTVNVPVSTPVAISVVDKPIAPVLVGVPVKVTFLTVHRGVPTKIKVIRLFSTVL